jgi:hypothetical protein
MADISDHIPADAIRFDEAFKRLCDADPRAAEVRAELDHLGAELDRPEAKVSVLQWADPYNKLQDLERDVGRFFLHELKYGALNAYRRDPRIGQEVRVPAEEWEGSEIWAGDYVSFPPIYFRKSEFAAWLRKVSGRKGRGRPPDQRKKAKDILVAVFGTAQPPEEIDDDDLYAAAKQYCVDKQISYPPDKTTFLRASGRRQD